jgi:hypothetical protein
MVKNASAEQICIVSLDMFALYTRRENLWFAVVKSPNTTSLTPVGLFIIHFFCTRSGIRISLTLCE